MQNRITPQDIADFDAINRAFDQTIARLEKMTTGIEGAINNLKGDSAALTEQAKQLNLATAAGREENSKAAAKVDELARAYKAQAQALDKNRLQIEEVKAVTRQINIEKKLEAQLNRSAAGSYDNLAAKYGLLKIKLNAMSDAQRGATKEGRAMEQQAKQLYTEMDRLQKATGKGVLSVGNYENAIGGLKTRFMDFVKGGFIVSGVMAIVQGITQLGRRTIEVNKQVSDSLGDIKRIAQISNAETRKIFEGVKALDTRTGINNLLELTAVGARLGVAKKELVGFTKALDSLKVALGNELGENAEEVSTKIGKLANIFDVEGEDTGEKFLRIGNAIVDLANRGVATGEFLSDFSTRLAGISEISGITLGSVLGMGAGFEELGQSSEVAGTAVTQLILKIGQDVPKYARLAGRSVEDFARTLNEKPAEALIQLAEGLSTNKKGFAELSTAFAEAEARGVRVGATLGVIGKNADFFRTKIEFANEALTNTGQIALATAIKQETLAAKTEKVGTAFDELVANDSMQNFFGALASFVFYAIKGIEALANDIGGLMGATGKNVKDLTADFENQTKAAIELDDVGSKLVKRYNELNDIEILNPKQREELSAITKQLGNLFPSAAGSRDENGNAIAVNTNLIVEMIRQQAKLAVVTQKEAVKAIESEISAIEKRIKLNDVELKQLQDKAAASTDPASYNASIIAENNERTLNIAKLKEQRDALERVRAGIFSTAPAVEESTQLLNQNTAATDKNTKAKKKGLTEAEKIAIEANRQLGEQNLLADLLAAEEKKLNEDALAVPITFTTDAADGSLLGDTTKLTSDIELVITNAQKRAQEFAANADKEFNFWKDIFGLDDEEAKKAAAGVETALNFAKSQLDSYMQAVQRAADARVQESDRSVAAAENEYNRQVQFSAAGEANTAATAQAALETAKKQQQEALENQKRVQRQQILLNSALEASNLTLAIAKLFAEKNVLAIPLAALMIGSFIAAKAGAIKATKQEFAEGGYEFIGGGTHASGNDTDLGFSTKKGKRAFAQRGEFHGIVNHTQVPKYKAVLPTIIDSLNNGTFYEQFAQVGKSAANLQFKLDGRTDTGKMEQLLGQLVANSTGKGEGSFQQLSPNVYREVKGNLTRTVREA